jgi:hypothetical protein
VIAALVLSVALRSPPPPTVARLVEQMALEDLVRWNVTKAWMDDAEEAERREGDDSPDARECLMGAPRRCARAR